MGAKELSCGYDFTFGKGGAGTTETLCRVAERHGVKVNVVEPVTLDGEPVSSTLHPARQFWRERWTRPAACWAAASACG